MTSKKNTKKDDAPAKATPNETIQVNVLMVRPTCPADIPWIRGMVGDTITSDAQTMIEYHPALRHHAVINRTNPSQRVYLHESWVAWVPVL